MAGGDWKEMFRAIQYGDLELVRYYLRMGIDPNYQHPEFLVSPLVESIRYNQVEIARLLLEHGADPKIVEINGKEITVTREVDTGLETIKMTGPAVITCDLRLNTPKIAPLAMMMKAKKAKIE